MLPQIPESFSSGSSVEFSIYTYSYGSRNQRSVC